MQDNDPHNRVILKIKSMLVKQFDNTKNFLSEKIAKLIMVSKL